MKKTLVCNGPIVYYVPGGGGGGAELLVGGTIFKKGQFGGGVQF